MRAMQGLYWVHMRAISGYSVRNRFLYTIGEGYHCQNKWMKWREKCQVTAWNLFLKGGPPAHSIKGI